MVYSKTRKSRRFAIRKRKRTYSRARSRSQVRLNRIARRLRPENKFLISNMAQAAIPNPLGRGYIWNAMAEGTDSSTRVGNKIRCTGLSLKGFLLGTGVNAQVVRMVTFIWNDSVAPTQLAVMQSNDVNSPYFAAAAPKFKILHDKSFNISPTGVAGAIKHFEVHLKLNTTTSFTGPNAGDWLGGVIYTWFIVTTNNAVDVAVDGIVRYFDS